VLTFQKHFLKNKPKKQSFQNVYFFKNGGSYICRSEDKRKFIAKELYVSNTEIFL